MVSIITVRSKNYPKLLRAIPGRPKVLHYKGKLKSSLFENCLGVVGSRRVTDYGNEVTRKLVSEVASCGITIVSGFMRGVDATAHKASLDVGGSTIAVMPCGINVICPSYQSDLYYEIVKSGGLIFSEFDGDLKPKPWTFVRRNRIVAGLSKAVLVVEATKKSGTLITANYAKKFGRKVLVIPFNKSTKTSEGVLELLKSNAKTVKDSSDILSIFEADKTSV